jgi:hypothetical protein
MEPGGHQHREGFDGYGEVCVAGDRRVRLGPHYKHVPSLARYAHTCM